MIGHPNRQRTRYTLKYKDRDSNGGNYKIPKFTARHAYIEAQEKEIDEKCIH